MTHEPTIPPFLLFGSSLFHASKSTSRGDSSRQLTRFHVCIVTPVGRAPYSRWKREAERKEDELTLLGDEIA